MADEEKEVDFFGEEYEQLVEEQKQERIRMLQRRPLPKSLTLAAALSALTKKELEDIKYNLNVSLQSGQKKSELVEALIPQVIAFSRRWFTTILEEQKELFDFLISHEGISTTVQSDDIRLDYLRGIGILYCGMQGEKLAWYMPRELREEYGKINNGAFNSMVTLNTEVMRLSAGLVYHYGLLDYDQLLEKVNKLIDEPVEFADFMGIMLNGGCWHNHVVTTPTELLSADLINADALRMEQAKRENIPYADIAYDRLWEAGAEGYAESTPEYRELAQFFMKSGGADVLQAAEDVKTIFVIIQNGYGINEIMGFLNDRGLVPQNDKGKLNEMMELLQAYNDNLTQWVLKGHTPNEVKAMPRTVVKRKKVGRNDPCPCGSGKKFKNCCIDKY